MTFQDLQAEISHCVDNPSGLEIYFILQSPGQDSVIKRADIETAVQNKLHAQFINKLRSSLVQNHELDIVSLSTADSRINAIYHYDLEERPREFALLDIALSQNDIQPFSFGTDTLDSVKGFILVLGNYERRIALFKHHYPISLIKKDSSLLLKLSGTNSRFTELDSDVLKINDKFEYFKVGDNYYVNDLNALEKFCSFKDIITREASHGVSAIERFEIVENIELLREDIDTVSFARKLVKAASRSPVLGVVSRETVIMFVKNHPHLRGKLRTNEDDTKIVFHTKKSRVLFLKLLSDDYLRSELTQSNYDSLAKDRLDS